MCKHELMASVSVVGVMASVFAIGNRCRQKQQAPFLGTLLRSIGPPPKKTNATTKSTPKVGAVGSTNKAGITTINSPFHPDRRLSRSTLTRVAVLNLKVLFETGATCPIRRSLSHILIVNL